MGQAECSANTPPTWDAPTTLIGPSASRSAPKIDATTPGSFAGNDAKPSRVAVTREPANPAVAPMAATGP